MENETTEPTVYGRETDETGRVWERLSAWDVPPGRVVPRETFRDGGPDFLVSRGADGVARVNVLAVRRLVPTEREPAYGFTEAVFRRTADGWEREI